MDKIPSHFNTSTLYHQVAITIFNPQEKHMEDLSNMLRSHSSQVVELALEPVPIRLESPNFIPTSTAFQLCLSFHV